MSAKVQLIISGLIAHIGAALENRIARRSALVPDDEWLLSPIYWAESSSTPLLRGLRRQGSNKQKGEWTDQRGWITHWGGKKTERVWGIENVLDGVGHIQTL
ncbi:uncharacterized [Tachysurus ichikawai]